MAEENIIDGLNQQLFNSHIDDVLTQYPKLKRSNVNNRSIITGILDIIDKNGKLWDSYDIEIHCSDEYPYRYPNLFEVSNKIPKIADWHIYEDTLSCCVTIPPKEIIRCKYGITLLEYINEEVLPYFFNQTHRRTEGYYVNGEYSHGARGLFEFYSEVTGIKDLSQLIKLIVLVANTNRPSRTSICFCGSNLKYRHCHKSLYEKLADIGTTYLMGHATILINSFKQIL